jgi:hypothetical protein
LNRVDLPTLGSPTIPALSIDEIYGLPSMAVIPP